MKKTTLKDIFIFIIGILVIVELVIGIITIQYPLLDIISLIPLLFVALYLFFFYKKPHSNMLKYAMLIFALCRVIESIGCIKQGFEVFYNQTAKIISSLILIYVAGRLDRINENRILLPISFALTLVAVFIAVFTFSSQYSTFYIVSWFGEPVLVLGFLVSYFARYYEHKESGIKSR